MHGSLKENCPVGFGYFFPLKIGLSGVGSDISDIHK